MTRILVSALALLLLATTAHAVDSEGPLDDPELQARYEKIVAEVRCLKCQNQTIKDSNAFLAGDLRREIRRMLLEGYTDEQIFDFLVDRYGDFALYNPRMSGKTLIVWLVPGLFVLGGAWVLFNIVRRRIALPIDDGADHDAKD